MSSGGGTTATSTSWQMAGSTPSKAGSLPRGTTPPHSVSPMRTPDFYVIRVSISTPCKETEGINLYKSIMISNHEKTPQVIRNAMLKHALDGNPDDFVLAQLLPKAGNFLFTTFFQFLVIIRAFFFFILNFDKKSIFCHLKRSKIVKMCANKMTN